MNDGAEARTYNLDGSESRFEGAATNRYRSQMTARTRWIGSALVIATTSVSEIGTWEDLHVYSLDYGPTLTMVNVFTQTTRPLMGTETKAYHRK